MIQSCKLHCLVSIQSDISDHVVLVGYRIKEGSQASPNSQSHFFTRKLACLLYRDRKLRFVELILVDVEVAHILAWTCQTAQGLDLRHVQSHRRSMALSLAGRVEKFGPRSSQSMHYQPENCRCAGSGTEPAATSVKARSSSSRALSISWFSMVSGGVISSTFEFMPT